MVTYGHKNDGRQVKSRHYYIVALSKYIRGFIGYLLGAVVSKLLCKAIPIIMNFLAAYYISSSILDRKGDIFFVIAALSLCVIFNVIFGVLDIYISHDMSYKILTDLRNQVYKKIDEVYPSDLNDEQTGNLISIIMHDIEFFEWFYAHIVLEWFSLGSLMLIILVLLGHFSLILPAVIIPFIIIIAFTPAILANHADSQGKCVRDTAGSLNSLIIDGIQGIKDIISFDWAAQYFEKFSALSSDYEQATIRYSKRGSKEKKYITFISELGSISIVGAIIYLLINDQLDKHFIVSFILLSLSIFSPLQEALRLSTNYGFVYGAAKRTFDLLHLTPNVVDDGYLDMSDVMGDQNYCMISFEDVSFSYAPLNGTSSLVLDKLSFEIESGHSVVLVSESGGGKTTVARLLQRLWDVNSGTIKINGIDIRNIKISSLRDLVTVVTQDIYLFNDTVYENIRLANQNASKEMIESACKHANAHDFIIKLPSGYQTVIGERGLNLSGGERQRLSLAQAFLKNSQILVLDEASSSLDYNNERLVNIAVAEIKKNRTTLVIAHRLSTIKSADSIVFLEHGKVKQVGSYEELIEDESFRELVGAYD